MFSPKTERSERLVTKGKRTGSPGDASEPQGRDKDVARVATHWSKRSSYILVYADLCSALGIPLSLEKESSERNWCGNR